MTRNETAAKLNDLENKLIDCATRLKRVYFDNERYFDTVLRSTYQSLDNPSYSYGSQGELSDLLVDNPDEWIPELNRTIEEYERYKHAAECDGYGPGAAARGFDVTRPIGRVWTLSCEALRILHEIKDIITEYNNNKPMTTINNQSEYIQAVNLAKLHNHLYWVEHAPRISDAEFDDIVFSIEQYEQQHPDQILPDSPTREVGTEAGAHTIPHRIPMLSTQKVKDIDAVKAWMKSTTKRAEKIINEHRTLPFRLCSHDLFSLEWKYDGVSCSLVYQDGILIEASTRGDTKLGLGKDILGHIKREYGIKDIPKFLQYHNAPAQPTPINVPGRVEVRGEIVCPYLEFGMAMSKNYPDQRTAAASVLNTDPAETDLQPYLRFVAWQLITEGDTINHPTKAVEVRTVNHNHNMDYLRGFGFVAAEPFLVDADEVEEFIGILTEQRSSLPYPTDGLIIKYYNNRLWPHFGSTEHHPKYLLAYKFRPQGAETTIRSIEITIGEKTGKRTPIAHFDPVSIGGKLYAKCSLGSEAVMQQKGIREGSRVVVVIANDVIPQIDRVITQ